MKKESPSQKDNTSFDKALAEHYQNLTVDEIMEDYEGADSWETLLSYKDGALSQFKCHKNGKHYFCVKYSKKYGEILLSEQIRTILSQETVEKQMEHFIVAESQHYYKTAYGENSNEKLLKCSAPLLEYSNLIQLILYEKIIVGAIIKTSFGNEPLLFGKPICVYSASDNEGSGTNERDDYAYLLFQDELNSQ